MQRGRNVLTIYKLTAAIRARDVNGFDRGRKSMLSYSRNHHILVLFVIGRIAWAAEWTRLEFML